MEYNLPLYDLHRNGDITGKLKFSKLKFFFPVKIIYQIISNVSEAKYLTVEFPYYNILLTAL